MCGICGFFNQPDTALAPHLLSSMTAALRHRGPDDSGMWLDESRTVGLGSTRLAIIDLEGGAQPMISADGTQVIVFNGEIYNFREVRAQLENCGQSCRTNSDTEVLLSAFRYWGRECLSHLRGMFAFAIYDLPARKLFLARDRTGIKPLYYHHGPAGFFFASELKSILVHQAVPRRMNYQALADYLVFGYPLAPETFFRDCFEALPGSWMEITSSGVQSGRYWEWQAQAADARQVTPEGVEAALTATLKEHLESDVPVGAFLSGGVDSSLLVALLSRGLGRKVSTFTVRFDEQTYDESEYANSVAKQLETDHHELSIANGNSDLGMVESVLTQFDQPFGDSSAIPTYLLCREIRKHVKVVLGGDGGDEMFGGYERFRYADMARAMGATPSWVLNAADRSLGSIERIFPDKVRQARRLIRAAQHRDDDRLVLLSAYTAPDELPLVLLPEISRSVASHRVVLHNGAGPHHDPGGREFIDVTVGSVLPNDYLRKVDMMSSAHGLEVRVPFLGEQVLELSARTPTQLKYSLSENKILLRRLARKYLPPHVATKPKWGFGIPLDSWLGDSGRRDVHSILGSSGAKVRAYVAPKFLNWLLDAFVSQRWDRAGSSRLSVYQRVYFLWSLESWLQRWNPAA